MISERDKARSFDVILNGVKDLWMSGLFNRQEKY